MKKTIIFLLILSVFSVRAQKKGKITYELAITKNTEKKKANLSDIFKVEDNALLLNKTEFEVLFDEESAYFPPLLFEDENNTAISHFPLDEEYFISNKEKKAYSPAEYKDEEVLGTISNYKWKTHKESKTIGKFTVYKATTQDYEREITAWYAPELPYSYGPIDIFGLPGLILEVYIKDEILYAYRFKSLEFNDRYKVKPIPDLKKLDEKEMDEYYKDYYRNYYKNLKERLKK